MNQNGDIFIVQMIKKVYEESRFFSELLQSEIR